MHPVGLVNILLGSQPVSCPINKGDDDSSGLECQQLKLAQHTQQPLQSAPLQCASLNTHEGNDEVSIQISNEAEMDTEPTVLKTKMDSIACTTAHWNQIHCSGKRMQRAVLPNSTADSSDFRAHTPLA